MDQSEQMRAAHAMRRAVLGDEYVDGMTADDDPAAVAARREIRAVRAARQG